MVRSKMIYNFEIKGQVQADSYEQAVSQITKALKETQNAWIHSINIKEWINQPSKELSNETLFKQEYSVPLKNETL